MPRGVYKRDHLEPRSGYKLRNPREAKREWAMTTENRRYAPPSEARLEMERRNLEVMLNETNRKVLDALEEQWRIAYPGRPSPRSDAYAKLRSV